MACSNPQNPTCKNCNKDGLAILPARYAVVPASVSATLPGSLGNKVTDTKLAHHKYALRTLRQGFFYIYYENHPRGSQYKWEVYGVAPQGTLWRQLAITALTAVTEEPACARNGDNIPASVIHIEQPENQGKVWLAFSEHAWSAETFKDFDGDGKEPTAKRDERMQTFEPKLWLTGKGYKHGLEGTVANIEKIIEYQDNFAQASLTGGNAVPEASEENGKHKDARLKKQSTRHSLHMRKDQSVKVATLMRKIGEVSQGNPREPMVMAVWDAVGITHELNGFRNDTAGVIEQYGKERELQITAMNAIDGVKKALEKKVDQQVDSMVNNTKGMPRTAEAMALNRNVIGPNTKDPAGFASKYWPLDDKYQNGKISPADYQRQREALIVQHAENPAAAQNMRSEFAKLDATRAKDDATRSANVDKMKTEGKAQSWPPYQAKLEGNGAVYEAFKANHNAFLKAADALVDQRTEDLIVWLESPALISALTELHPKNTNDGIVFDDQVGTALYGMNSSIKGQAKIDAWIKEMKATKTNLLWRAIAMNQEEGIQAVNDALKEAEDHKNQRTLASSLTAANYMNKSLKAFADTYKKFTSASNANADAGSTAGTKAFGAKLNTTRAALGADKVLVTTGDRIFKAFRVDGLADHASEKIIQHMFSIRALVDPLDSLELVLAQAKNDGALRAQTTARLNTAKTFLAAGTPPIKTAQSEAMAAAWAKLKSSTDAKDIKNVSRAVKDSRLALVVMLIEGMNFSKMMGDCAQKNDAKSWFGLAASGMTITSALMDIASAPVKVLYGAESWSFQKLKLYGGVLSSGATAITAVFDIKDAEKYFGKGQTTIANLFLAKGFIGFAGTALTGATTLSYAAPLIGRLTGRAAIGTAVEILGVRAAAIIGARILCMTLGGWITVGTFGIQVIIWSITDDDLQTWCSLCAFGSKRIAPDAYKSVKEQDKALEEAMVAVGV
jgi:hypothetical protein